MDADLAGCTNITVPSDIFVPIFIMTRDRVSSLRVALESYERTIKSPYEIIILDHNSSYPPMLAYLRMLKAQKIIIKKLTSPSWNGALSEAKQEVREYLEWKNSDSQFYVFTDPDIALLRTAPDLLLFYAGVLLACPEIDTIGPALQISDIPPQFTKRLKNKNMSVFEWESQFWRSVPSIATWNGVGYHIASEPIDTTFSMYRRNLITHRHAARESTLRAYAPYAAVHVDWYQDSANLPADKLFYIQQQTGANNW